ncbi:hypothetical protein Pve01_12560 [Planomonospora venezuelensis]|nr:hypothetical protein Pve01_12560 [Planomonospora venezuelensis]
MDLADQSVLKIPAITSGSYTTGAQEGEIKVEPQELKFGFTPVKATEEVNDSALTGPMPNPPAEDGRLYYKGKWSYEFNHSARIPPTEWVGSVRDRKDDVHHTQTQGDTATIKFEGTGIEYIGERHKLHGDVKVELLDAGGNSIPEYSAEIISPWLKTSSEGAPEVEEGKRYASQVLWAKTDLPYGRYQLVLTSEAKASRPYMMVDGFNVINKEHVTPPKMFDTVCKPSGPVVAATVKVQKTSASPSPTPTTKTPTPKPTVTVTASPGGTATAKPTVTVTATVTPTRATPTTPQVTRVPVGGADTGVGPEEERSGMGLVGLGSVMVFGSAVGGVMLRRRRAAHTRGRG